MLVTAITTTHAWVRRADFRLGRGTMGYCRHFLLVRGEGLENSMHADLQFGGDGPNLTA